MFLVIVFFFAFLIYPQTSDDSCPPPSDGSGSPGGDNADDNYSYADGSNSIIFKNNNVLIYKNGYFLETDSLLNGAIFKLPETADSLIRFSPVLIIPAGGLFGKENDTSLKITLEEYLKSGGTVVVFAQQCGSDFDNLLPVPKDETLKTFG